MSRDIDIIDGIQDNDRRVINYLKKIGYGYAEFAKSVELGGMVSQKQRECMERMVRRVSSSTPRNARQYRVDNKTLNEYQYYDQPSDGYYDEGDDKLKCSRLLYSTLKKTGCRVVNVAGNGIYHFKELGVTQEDINQYVYDILKPVAQHIELEKIVSGGQTGADIAGLVAAVALGVYAVGTYPKGFKMRYEKGVDTLCLPGEIGDMIVNYSLKVETGD